MSGDRNIHIEHDANGNLIITGDGNRVYVFPGVKLLSPEIVARIRTGQLDPGDIPGGVQTSIPPLDVAAKSVKAIAPRIADLAAKLDEVHADQRKRGMIAGEVSLPRMIATLRSAQARAETRGFRKQIELDNARISAIIGALRKATALADNILSASLLTVEDDETLLGNARELRDRVGEVRRHVGL